MALMAIGKSRTSQLLPNSQVQPRCVEVEDVDARLYRHLQAILLDCGELQHTPPHTPPPHPRRSSFPSLLVSSLLDNRRIVSKAPPSKGAVLEVCLLSRCT